MNRLREGSNQYTIMHIPKCAGTSLRKMIEKSHKNSEDTLFFYKNNKYYHELLKYSFKQTRAKFIMGHFGVMHFSKFGDDRSAITFVREPIERVLSLYRYWGANNLPGIGPMLAKCLPIADFLQSDIPEVREQISNLQTWMFVADKNIEVRMQYAAMSDDELVETAIKNLVKFQFIGLTETFNEDIRYLNQACAWGIGSEVIKENVTINHICKEELDLDTLSILKQITRLDRILYDFIKNEIYPRQFG